MLKPRFWAHERGSMNLCYLVYGRGRDRRAVWAPAYGTPDARRAYGKARKRAKP